MLDKEAKVEVDEAVEEAKKSPDPVPIDLWTDIYYKGTEPPSMRGREREEVRLFFFSVSYVADFFPRPCLDSPLLIARFF
jgi:pyruvate dehydrogenase E1 component alpha subunit